jgi:hypothetical protein
MDKGIIDVTARALIVVHTFFEGMAGRPQNHFRPFRHHFYASGGTDVRAGTASYTCGGGTVEGGCDLLLDAPFSESDGLRADKLIACPHAESAEYALPASLKPEPRGRYPHPSSHLLE